eukprot:10798256-Heterocapsa_arctica.AAC.1
MDGLLDPDLGAIRPIGGARDVHVVGGAGADLVVRRAAFLDADDVEVVGIELALKELGAAQGVEAFRGEHRVV